MYKMWTGLSQTVVATHPEVARSILTRPQVFVKTNIGPDFTIADQLLNRDDKGEQCNMVFINGEKWASIRKPIDPAFDKASLAHITPKFVECSDMLLKHWRESEGPVDVKRDMSRFALDVLGHAILGRSFNALEGSFQETYDHYSFVMQETTNPLYVALPMLEKLPLPRNRKLQKSTEHVHSMLQDAVESRIQARRAAASQPGGETPPQDMLDMLLGPGPNPEPCCGKGALVPVLWVMFVAGHDTTALSLTWLMNWLAVYPEVQRRAREEAVRVMGGATAPTAEMLEEVPYLDAVISENLRLRPPVYNLPTRLCAEDTELDGFFLPKGTNVSLHIGAINRHPDVWDRPESFEPERFLQAKRPRVFHWLPFSAGPRRCLGDKFSLMEQKTLLMMLLTRMEILPKAAQEAEAPLASDSIATAFMIPREMRVQLRDLP